jgi:hypothetical protein
MYLLNLTRGPFNFHTHEREAETILWQEVKGDKVMPQVPNSALNSPAEKPGLVAWPDRPRPSAGLFGLCGARLGQM